MQCVYWHILPHEITQGRLYCVVLRTVALETNLLETVTLKEVLVAFII